MLKQIWFDVEMLAGNNLFSNTILNLDISSYSFDEPYVSFIEYSTSKAIYFLENIQASLPFRINTNIK